MFRLATAAFLAAMALALPASAADFTAGDMVVQNPWARASAGMARAGAAYMTIMNKGGEADRLIAAEGDVAKRVELHTHLMENGVMKMRQVEGIDVPAGGMAELKPGGFHIMMMNLSAPLNEGDSFPLTLVFEKAGRVQIEVPVLAPGAMGAMGGMDHSKMGNGSMQPKTGTDSGSN